MNIELADAYKFPLWLLNRAQQALFQGAKAGGESFGNQIYDAPYGKELQTIPWALASSTIPAVKAAFNSPTQEDIRGEDLGAGKVGGFALDMTADPLSLVGGVASRVPQMARTLKNVGTYANTPYTSEFIKRIGIEKPWNIMSWDVPKPFTPGQPFYAAREGSALPASALGGHPSSLKGGQAAGYYLSGGDLEDVPGKIVTSMSNRPTNVRHEKFHSEWDKIAGGEARGDLSWKEMDRQASTTFPGYAKEVDQSYNLSHGPGRVNEILARAAANGETWGNPTVQGAMQRSYNLPPELLYQDPWARSTVANFATPPAARMINRVNEEYDPRLMPWGDAAQEM